MLLNRKYHAPHGWRIRATSITLQLGIKSEKKTSKYLDCVIEGAILGPRVRPSAMPASTVKAKCSAAVSASAVSPESPVIEIGGETEGKADGGPVRYDCSAAMATLAILGGSHWRRLAFVAALVEC